MQRSDGLVYKLKAADSARVCTLRSTRGGGWRGSGGGGDGGMLGGWRGGGIMDSCGTRFGVRWVMSAIHPTNTLLK
jgi:hypothetical protein